MLRKFFYDIIIKHAISDNYYIWHHLLWFFSFRLWVVEKDKICIQLFKKCTEWKKEVNNVDQMIWFFKACFAEHGGLLINDNNLWGLSLIWHIINKQNINKTHIILLHCTEHMCMPPNDCSIFLHLIPS